MKYRHSLFILPILCLASCGKTSLVGKYSFLLGREEPTSVSTKIGLTVELTNESFVYEKNKPLAGYVASYAKLLEYDTSSLNDKDIIYVVVDETHGNEKGYYEYNKSTNTFTYKGSTQEKEVGTIGKKFLASGELEGSFADLPSDIVAAISKGLYGYYEETQYKDERYGTRLNVGTFFNEENIPGLQDIYRYIEKEAGETAAEVAKTLIENIDSFIDGKLVEYILCTYCDGNTLTFQIPVSLNDLQQQLTWYGRYIDIDDEVASRIHSIKDFFDNISGVLETLKVYDLKEHRTKITGKSSSEGELVQMPGLQGEERFGSVPTVNSKVEPVIDEVDDMNKIYSSEFSNTYFYQKVDEEMVSVGTITSYHKTKEGASQTMHYYYDTDNLLTVNDASISGYVLAKDEFGVYKNYVPATISLVHDFTDPNLGIQIASVSKSPTEILSYDDFYKAPFNFRVFHRLPLSLKK